MRSWKFSADGKISSSFDVIAHSNCQNCESSLLQSAVARYASFHVTPNPGARIFQCQMHIAVLISNMQD